MHHLNTNRWKLYEIIFVQCIFNVMNLKQVYCRHCLMMRPYLGGKTTEARLVGGGETC